MKHNSCVNEDIYSKPYIVIRKHRERREFHDYVRYFSHSKESHVIIMEFISIRYGLILKVPSSSQRMIRPLLNIPLAILL